MREIKFRAWDKDNKEMTPYFKLGYVPELYSDKDVVMQWTGLKDRNGKDVYEGDIVKVNKGEYKGMNAVVEWCGDCCFAYRLQFVGVGNNEAMMRNGEIEIIGNIYENPNLIPN